MVEIAGGIILAAFVIYIVVPIVLGIIAKIFE